MKLTMGTVWKESHCKIDATSGEKYYGAHQNLMKITHFVYVGIRELMIVKFICEQICSDLQIFRPLSRSVPNIFELASLE